MESGETATTINRIVPMRTMAVLTRLTTTAILLALFSLSYPTNSVIAQQEIVTLPTRAGVTQSYVVTSIPKNLQAVALLFPGSGGLIQLRAENGKPRFNQGNFLVRSRAEFIKRRGGCSHFGRAI